MAKILQYSYICQQRFVAGNNVLSINLDSTEMTDGNILTAIYRKIGVDYPKFFKMDAFSKTGVLLSDLLFYQQNSQKVNDVKNKGAVIVFSISGTYQTDVKFENTISDAQNFFPSPAIFVYTLPNIVTGEIALRHGMHGETAYYSTQKFNPAQIESIVSDAIPNDSCVFVAWIDCDSPQQYGIMFVVANSNDEISHTFNAQNLEDIYNKCFN